MTLEEKINIVESPSPHHCDRSKCFHCRNHAPTWGYKRIDICRDVCFKCPVYINHKNKEEVKSIWRTMRCLKDDVNCDCYDCNVKEEECGQCGR